jgi:hypothetical protein
VVYCAASQTSPLAADHSGRRRHGDVSESGDGAPCSVTQAPSGNGATGRQGRTVTNGDPDAAEHRANVRSADQRAIAQHAVTGSPAVLRADTMEYVRVVASNLDSRGRPLIYSVGPNGDGDRLTPMRPWPALLRSALAAVAVLAAGFGSSLMVVWLVLAPNIPTGSADEELRAPFPAQTGQKLDQRDGEPTAIVTQPSSVTPPTAEQRGPESQGTDSTSAIVKKRPDGMPHMMAAPAVVKADHRLRCAHNAASVR